MAKNNRIFISFAIEDAFYRDGLIQQADDERSPFQFIDMSVKEPWSDSWKTRCRSKIKGCDGVIALISRNTEKASGARWEIKCAAEEGIPMIGTHIHSDWNKRYTPAELDGYQVIDWTWEGIAKFINRL
jgi:nucleoside 2-deoxyribosyltransferase